MSFYSQFVEIFKPVIVIWFPLCIWLLDLSYYSEQFLSLHPLSEKRVICPVEWPSLLVVVFYSFIICISYKLAIKARGLI